MARIAWSSLLVTLVTWAGLVVGLGNVGLQQSISIGPAILIDQYPAVLIGTFAVAALGGFASANLLRLSGPDVFLSATIVVMLDLLMALVIAPFLIGELTVEMAPLTLAAVSALGLQPVGVLVGGLFARSWMARRDVRR